MQRPARRSRPEDGAQIAIINRLAFYGIVCHHSPNEGKRSLAEAMRMASLAVTPQAVWSRAMAGIRGTSLILNLPGSRKAARENLNAVLPALAHGLEKIHGSQMDCAAETRPLV